MQTVPLYLVFHSISSTAISHLPISPIHHSLLSTALSHLSHSPICGSLPSVTLFHLSLSRTCYSFPSVTLAHLSLSKLPLSPIYHSLPSTKCLPPTILSHLPFPPIFHSLPSTTPSHLPLSHPIYHFLTSLTLYHLSLFHLPVPHISPLDGASTLKPHRYKLYLLISIEEANLAQKTATASKYPTPRWQQHFKIARVPVVLAQNCWRGRFGGPAGMPASLAPKKLQLALNILPPDGAITLKLHGCQSYLLKTVGGANLEGLLGCQLRWHPKYCNWH